MTPSRPLDRRAVLATTGALVAAPALSQAQPQDAAMSRCHAVQMAIIEAWRRQDVEGVLIHLTDDIVWQNSSGLNPPIQGKAAMRSVLQGMAKVIKTNRWRLFDYAERRNTLFVEGVDEFWLTTGEHVAIPYAGLLRFQGERVSEWTEYFDGRISAAMKAGEPASPHLQALISRPAAP